MYTRFFLIVIEIIVHKCIEAFDFIIYFKYLQWAKRDKILNFPQ